MINLSSIYNLIPQSSRVIVGVSGGADSMALLNLLISAGYECIVAHCHFHLRGAESDRDADFVKNTAQNKKLPFFKIDFYTEEYASMRKISIEMAARELRYDWFAELKKREKADYIAVAHHADDVLETFLINMSRGTGLKGLSGIKPLQGDVVRPLLSYTRKEILEYLDAQNISHVEDSTNHESVYVRNKFRNIIIPELENIYPSFRQNLLQTISHLKETEDFINSELEAKKEALLQYNSDTDSWNISISLLKSEQNQRFVLFEILRSYGFSSGSVTDILNGLDGVSGKQYFSQKYMLRKERNELVIRKIESQTTNSFFISDADENIEYPIRMRFRTIPISELNLCKNASHCYIDAEKIDFPLNLRKWKVGDFFIPFGMRGRKKVSDFFIDQRYSFAEKENSWILTSNEEIVWIVGKRSDDRFKITSETQKVLVIDVL